MPDVTGKLINTLKRKVMEKSASITNLAKALMLFHVKMESVKKDATNPFFRNRYASLSNILDSIKVPLEESGLIFSQLPVGENELTTILIHAETGEFIQSSYCMKPSPEYIKEKDNNGNVIWRSETFHTTPQGRGSAITYQRRYALAAILGLNIDEDDDANTGTHGGKTPEQADDNNKLWLNENTKEFEGAVKKLKEGTTTIAKIRAVMKVSKKTEEALMKALNNDLKQTA